MPYQQNSIGTILYLDVKGFRRTRSQEPRTKGPKHKNQNTGTKTQEPRTKTQEPKHKNQRTKSQEPKNQITRTKEATRRLVSCMSCMPCLPAGACEGGYGSNTSLENALLLN